MKALCHVCFKSNTTCVINGVTGFPECTSCIKKEVVKLPDLTCYCKDCQVHNPIESTVEPTPLDLPIVLTPEG